jgi:phosphatidate cytidylyltransferase
MTNADPARPVPTASSGGSELILRILSGLVLAPLAVGVAYLGGWAFVVFWSIAALLVLWEWCTLVAGGERSTVLLIAAAAVLFALLLGSTSAPGAEGSHGVRLVAGATLLLMGMLATAVLAPSDRRMWTAAGIPYAGLLGMAPIVLRNDAQYGFLAIVFLFAVVWATDIVAYFIGRAVGGPKLAPRISPKKTWSGAVGGTVAAIAAAILVAVLAGLPNLPALGLIAAAASALAQGGDLFESALKRRFGAKDSSHLIPGHGGLMDRLDGFVAAAILATLIGLIHGGVDEPARGLLVW